MITNVNLIAFGTFGSPNGYRQTFFTGNIELSNIVKTFDLNSNAIKVVPNAKIYSIRKENLNSNFGISYSIYTFAKEQNSERGGTFIGSSILYSNQIANEAITLSVLNDFHSNVVAKNIINDIIQGNHSEKLSVSKPKDFDKVTYNLKDIGELSIPMNSNKYLVVYSEIRIDKIQSLFEKSIDLLSIYNTIYFTDNNEIAEFVYQKGLYKLIKIEEFNQEIEIVLQERKQKIINSISEFERKKQELQLDKETVLASLKNQLESIENSHIENEKVIRESKSNIEKINSFYNEFGRKIDDYSNQLRSNGKLDKVRQLYNENLQEFRNSVATLKQPQYIKKLDKIKTTSNLKQGNRSQYSQSTYQSDTFERQEYVSRGKSSKFNNYKVFTFVFGLLWLGTLCYFLLFDNQKKNEPELTNEQKMNTSQTPIPN